MTKHEVRKLDKQIEAIFYRRCSGVQIPVMRISEVFSAGRRAALAGLDVESAVVDTALSIAADLAVRS